MTDLLTDVNEDKNILSSLSKKNKDKIASQTAGLWRSYTDAIRPLLDESEENWRLICDYKPTLKWDVNKKEKIKGITLGLIPKNVETVISVQHNITFPGNDRFFRGTPRNEKARALREQYEQWAMDNINAYGIINKQGSHRLNSMVDGTAAAAVHYKMKKEKKTVYEENSVLKAIDPMFIGFLKKLLGAPKNKKTVKEVVILEGTDFEPLNFNDWRADPSADSLDDACFLRRYYEETYEVKKQYGLKEVNSYHQAVEDYRDQARDEMAGILSIEDKEVEGKEKALLMVRYDDFVVDGKVYKNHVAIVLNDTELVWFSPNPYNHGMKPFVVTPYHKIPGGLYGKSGIRDARAMAHVSDTAATQIIDQAKWSARPPWTLNTAKAADLKMGKIEEVQPGQIIPEGVLKPLPMPGSVSGELLTLIQQLSQSIEDSMGSSAALSGQDPSAGKGNITAFQVSTHVQGAMNRFLMPMNHFNETSLKRFIQMKFENDQQFLESDYLVPGFEEILTPEDIQLMDVDWLVTSNQASMQRQQQVNLYLELLGRLPELVANGVAVSDGKVYQVSPGDIFKNVMKLAGFQDTDEVFKLVESQEELTQASVMDPLQGGVNGGSSGSQLPSDAGVMQPPSVPVI